MWKMRLSFLPFMRLLFGLTTFSVVFYAIGEVVPFQRDANAAERVVLKYGPMRAPVSVSELTTFAETGEMSVSLQSYMGLAKQNPEEVRGNLTKSVDVSPRLLDRVLNHRLGERLLDRMGEVIHTPSGQANGQALRAALVLSASEDGEITLLETIQNYPAESVEIEVARLARLYSKLSFLKKLNL